MRLSERLCVGEKEKEFDLVVYPVEDHGWDEVSTRLDSFKRMTRWFDQHLRGSEGETEND